MEVTELGGNTLFDLAAFTTLATEPLVDLPEKKHYTSEEVKNCVLSGDAFSILPKLDAELFDLVFWDPPYFLQLASKELRRWKVNTKVEGVEESWDKFSSFAEYDAFIEKALLEIKRVLKPTGTLWVIGTYHNIFRIGRLLQDLGFWILNDVLWVKTNPMPNWLGVRFTNATETLIWALRDRHSKGYTFHRQQAKAFGLGKTGTNVWVLPIYQGKERLKDSQGKKLHPTQKPVELLKRIILTATNEGDWILDPMAGSGTTAHVAQSLGRNFVVIELEPKYVEVMLNRLSNNLKR